jgi:hypothetical protein
VNSDRTFETIRLVRAAVLYFAIVFAAGFVLGTIRFIVVIPLVGVRSAELIEMPFMVAICYLTARGVISRLRISYTVGGRLAMGMIALVLLLAAEVFVTVWVQRQSVTDYLQNRDPISGMAYLISLVLFAVFPLLVKRN